MTNIKPSDHGIVVENKESGQRYASHDRNFDPKNERKVRDLRAGESVMSYGVREPLESFVPASESLNTEGNPDTLEGLEEAPEGQQ